MPFVEGRLEQRISLLSDYDRGVWSVTELCAQYGIDRSTFYYWLRRREGGDEGWFADRSRAAVCCPHKTDDRTVEAVVRVRRQFPHFGPKKVLAYLRAREPAGNWPAASTIGDIFRRAGLIAVKRRRRRSLEAGPVTESVAAVNAEWACDFKGWFRTGDRMRCDPLTVSDGFSRFLVEVRIAPPTIDGVKPVFEQVFAEHGLPEAIRCDNGSPFGSTGAGGLTRLSVWWLKLGVRPRFTRPGSPQDNGRHERMHRDLKRQTALTPARDLGEQQARFDAFRRHFNEERPHEAIDQAVPASLWRPSPRAMPETLIEPWYDADHQVRRVRPAGDIKFGGNYTYVGEAFAGELVGLAEREDGSHLVRFFDIDLGIIDRAGAFRRFAPRRHWLRKAPEGESVGNVPGLICGE
jgi:transposase InsO family protein